MELYRNGTLLIITAALLFSISALCVKELNLRGQVPVFQVLATVAALCVLAASAVMRVHGHTLLPAKDRGMQALAVTRGVLGAGALVLFYLSMERLALKDAVTLFFTSPVWCALLERVFLPHDSPSLASLLACLLAVTGVFLVSQPDCMASADAHAVGIALALSAAVANSVAYLAMRALGKTISPVSLTWWFHGSTLCIAGAPLLARYPLAPVLPGGTDTLLLLSIAALQFVAQLLLSRGFQLVSATHGAALNTLQVLFACFWDALILHSVPSALGVLGAVFVVCGVLAITLLATADGTEWLRARLPLHWLKYAAVPAHDAERPGLPGGLPRQVAELKMAAFPSSQPPSPRASADRSLATTTGVDTREPGSFLTHRRHSHEVDGDALGPGGQQLSALHVQ